MQAVHRLAPRVAQHAKPVLVGLDRPRQRRHTLARTPGGIQCLHGGAEFALVGLLLTEFFEVALDLPGERPVVAVETPEAEGRGFFAFSGFFGGEGLAVGFAIFAGEGLGFGQEFGVGVVGEGVVGRGVLADVLPDCQGDANGGLRDDAGVAGVFAELKIDGVVLEDVSRRGREERARGEGGSDVESDHTEADGILLDCIDDPEVRRIFDNLTLWYA